MPTSQSHWQASRQHRSGSRQAAAAKLASISRRLRKVCRLPVSVEVALSALSTCSSFHLQAVQYQKAAKHMATLAYDTLSVPHGTHVTRTVLTTALCFFRVPPLPVTIITPSIATTADITFESPQRGTTTHQTTETDHWTIAAQRLALASHVEDHSDAGRDIPSKHSPVELFRNCPNYFVASFLRTIRRLILR